MKRRVSTLILLILVAGLSGYYGLTRQRDAEAAGKPSEISATVITPKAEPSESKANGFNKAQLSLTDPASPWAVVNKKRPLQPNTYVPADLIVAGMQLRSNITSDERQVRAPVAEALKKMSGAAKADGVALTLQSGYRSYNFQANLYGRYVSQQGQAAADTQSARAGYSEHQTGLAADLGGVTNPACNVEACFADTPEGKWMAAHAYRYGFNIRYPAGKTAVTGYTYEPWHLRYVGEKLAAEMQRQGIQTLEEFFGLPAAPDYN